MGKKKLLVIANFTAEECVFELPEDITYSEAELFIHNLRRREWTDRKTYHYVRMKQWCSN